MHLRPHPFLFRLSPSNISSISTSPVLHTTRSSFVSPLLQYRACSNHYKPFKLPQTPTVRGLHNSTDNAENTVEPPKPATMSNADPFSKLSELNGKWRRNLSESHPELFEKLGQGQAPQILWIGCADSRCPETTILGLQPGDIFCHRNIANILVPTDLNSLSVIQFAVQYLKVKHIIVCGHTSCGGVAAALDNKKLGLIDAWLMPLRAIRQKHLKELSALPTKEANLKLVDLNVRHSVETLMDNPDVINAMNERSLQVHGVIYNVGTGELSKLDIKEDEEVAEARKAAFNVA